jgi:hypothetical protein
MNKRSMFIVIGLALVAVLALTYGLAVAQDRAPGVEPAGPQAIAVGAIPIQGRLTDANGVALNGAYTLTFRLYDSDSASVAICSDVRPVSVVNGLFSDYMDHCYDDLYGQKVWLGIQVGSEAEMLPRQVIMAVPYALGLVPGAVISTTSDLALRLRTDHSSGKALDAIATSSTGVNYGLYASSNSLNGYGGYFYNSGSGVGVASLSVAGTAIQAGSLGGPAIRSSSSTGTALALDGTGRLTSTAKSYVWISGNDVRAAGQADTTVINLDSIGGAKITRGSGSGDRNVMLPITVPGPLYGQDVRVTGVDIYWVGETQFDAISVVLMRRQTGVCGTASCYVNLINDGADHVCDVSNNATGCVQSYTLSTNNTLSSMSGVLYLTLQLAFNSDTSYIELGGVRLTLEHD